MYYDERDMRMMDGRNPYGSRGGYVTSSRPRGRGRGRGRRGDRGMDYGYQPHDMRRAEYENAPMRQDMRMDGHYGHGGRQGGYEPMEFMGYCTGYAGAPQDHRGRDYGYDMRGDYRGGDYGYYPQRQPYMDYGGDFGETLSTEELDRWAHKLMGELDEREKQLFHKDTIMQKANQMGKPMEGFGEKELYVATLMCYTDYKQTIGQSPDTAIKLAYDWLSDKDVSVRGAEKLCVYYDCIVEGE